jgi:hypothetical protein
MFDIKTDKKSLDFILKWHSNLKENKNDSKLVANSSYSLTTVLITNCFLLCFLVNSFVYKGLFLKTKKTLVIILFVFKIILIDIYFCKVLSQF